MPRQTMRMAAMMNRGLMSALLCGLMATTVHAQVHINVNIGPPPPVIVEAPPPMLFLPEPGIYVAAGTPYDIFFIRGRYYYFYEDNWFWGPGYGGPWTYVTYRTLPPGLRRYKVKQLREYREREYSVYRVEGRNFNGKHFYAAAGPDEKGNHHDNGKHKGGRH
jgi:hypothetical protein